MFVINKKYSKLENCFLDKQQSKKYKYCKNRVIFHGEKIIISTKNRISDLTIILDKFYGCTIEIINSKFYDITVIESENNNYNKVIFNNCKINHSLITLGNNTDAELRNCRINRLTIGGARNFCFDNIDVMHPSKIRTEVRTTDEKAKNIIIKNINASSIPYFDVTADNLKVYNSDIYINGIISDEAEIENTIIGSDQLIVENGILLGNSVVKGYSSIDHYPHLKSKNMIIAGATNLHDSCVEAINMEVSKNSILDASGSDIKVYENLIIKKDSHANFSNNDNSRIEVDNIVFDQNTKFTSRNLICENKSNEVVNANFNDLNAEKEKTGKYIMTRKK